MKGRTKRTVNGYKSNIWIDKGTIVVVVQKLQDTRYYLVEYNNCELIIPEDALEVIPDGR